MKLYLIALATIALFLGIFLGSQSIVFAAPNTVINATAKISVCGNGVKEFNEQCDGSSFGGRQCSYLGFDGGTLACSASCEYNTSNCTSVAEETATPLFSASIGGSYTIVDGGNSAEISLPILFYIKDVRLQMFAFNKNTIQSSAPAPAGKSFIGKEYNFLSINPNGNIVPTLSKPMTITLTYTSADTNGFDVSTFAPYYRKVGKKMWHLLSGYTVNTINRTITFTTRSFNSFAIFGSVVSVSPPPSGGGGGGGGVSTTPVPSATVTLSGRAYPGSTVTILKDAITTATTRIGENAKFSITVGGLSNGTYLFSVYAKDLNGNRSSVATVPITVTAAVNVNASGIFLAPTISVDKSEVKKGDSIRIFGQTTSKGKVTISVHSAHPLFFQTSSDKNGVYSYSFFTTPLGMGQHTTNVRSATNGEISRTSSSVSFAVGAQNVEKIKTKPHSLFLGDINSDNKVSIVDFSIESFWYKKPSPPSAYDLNGDGIVNIVDFSIMASHWTG